LIRPGAIGDTILSLPALECLRAGYTEVWVAARNVPLIRFADRVDSILATGLDTLGIPGREPDARLVQRLREVDSVISWYGTRRPEFREAVEALGLPVRFFPALPEETCGMHATDYYLAQARTLSDRRADPLPRIECPRGRGAFAVIHPFSGSPKKNWPLERYRELARRLSRHLPVRWCAGPEEPLDEAVRLEDLYALACWLATARLYVGNDSGITHLAAAVGTPVVALFGPAAPAIWAPRGEHVTVISRMEETAPETVLAAALALEHSSRAERPICQNRVEDYPLI
jgi:ADP-heptose:LPS heptosyltransferase